MKISFSQRKCKRKQIFSFISQKIFVNIFSRNSLKFSSFRSKSYFSQRYNLLDANWKSWTKISRKRGRKYIEICENLKRKRTNFVRLFSQISFNENFDGNPKQIKVQLVVMQAILIWILYQPIPLFIFSRTLPLKVNVVNRL